MSRHEHAQGQIHDAYWQMPVTDYVSAGSPTSRRVFTTREQLDKTWRRTITRFAPPEVIASRSDCTDS